MSREDPPVLAFNSECDGKLRFRNRGAAVMSLKHRQKRPKWRIKARARGCPLHAYRCRTCGHWHLGS